MYKKLIASLLSVVTALTLLVPHASAWTPDEDNMLQLHNRDRVTYDIGTLSFNQPLAGWARYHTDQMIKNNSIYHSSSYELSQYANGTSPDWHSIGENIAVGNSVDDINKALMNSAPHRANIMGHYNIVAISAVRDQSGRLWITELYLLAGTTFCS